jgi:hypothetical protein
MLVTICIGGGVMGVSTVSYTLFSLDDARQVFAAVFVIALYAIGIVAGVTLAEGKRNAVRFMILFFAVQIPVVSSDVVSFSLSALLSASIIFRGLLTFDIAWFFGTQWTLSIFTESATSGIGINAVPVALIVFLLARSGILNAPKSEQ